MSAKEYLKKNLNVPNVLSLLRLLLVPVYIILFVNGRKYEALAVFLAASITDLFDGLIARKYHLITDLGKLLDPFADKVMVLTAMFSMVIGNALIPPVLPWTAVIILLCKELVMMLGGLLMLKLGVVVYSSMIGKVAHCFFIGGLVLSYFHDWFVGVCVGWFMPLDIIVVWVAVALTLTALVFYVIDSVKKVKARDASKRS